MDQLRRIPFTTHSLDPLKSQLILIRSLTLYTVGHLNSPLAHTISSPVHLISSLVHLISSLTHLISSFEHSIRHACTSFRHVKIWLQCRAGADQTRSVNFYPPCTSFVWLRSEMLVDHKNELITLSVISYYQSIYTKISTWRNDMHGWRNEMHAWRIECANDEMRCVSDEIKWTSDEIKCTRDELNARNDDMRWPTV